MEVKKSELMFNGRILKVYKDEVLLDNGMEVTREVMRHQGAAAVVPITDNGEVILVKQYRYAVGKEMLEIPAGLLEPGEEMAVCAARETEEETGYKPMELIHLYDFFSSPGYCTERIGIFAARQLVPSRQHLDADEDVEVVVMPLEEAIEMIKRGEIVDGKTVAALMSVSAQSLI
ncbi:MAG: NUDIX hydrolase [Firmicutes bacterium]|nr:NUDIX hydrolase [Bacillota bacterium]